MTFHNMMKPLTTNKTMLTYLNTFTVSHNAFVDLIALIGYVIDQFLIWSDFGEPPEAL